MRGGKRQDIINRAHEDMLSPANHSDLLDFLGTTDLTNRAIEGWMLF